MGHDRNAARRGRPRRRAQDRSGRGNGLYGVDLKEINGIPHLIEINDNPSLDAGIEDEVLGMELYTAILKEFRNRIVNLRSRSNV